MTDPAFDLIAPEALLAEALQMPVKAIPANAAFGSTPQWDSMAHLRLLLLEEKLGLTPNETLMNKVSSLDSLRAVCKTQTQNHCDPAWEAIYAARRELNRYPHHYLVGYAFRNFPTLEKRQSCRVLEVGCGAGNNISFLAREGFTVSGIDGAPSAVAAAKEAVALAGLQSELMVGDFTRLPWDNATFDLVVDRCSLASVSQHSLAVALNEITRVLKPGGRFFSMIYSDLHPALRYGRKTDSHTYEQFTDGYFEGHGVLTVCDQRQIQTLYGSRFEILSAKLMEEADHIPDYKPVNALWVIDARKQDNNGRH